MKNKKEIKKQNRSTKKPVSQAAAGIDRRYYFALLIIALITFVVYLPALHNGFVWDDDDYIRNNPLIRSINFKEIFSGYVMGNYHPLTILTHAFEFHFFDLSEKGYHTINLLIHILNVILVFYTVFLLSEKTAIALVASLLFGIHPIHVESVAWASELKDLLYTLFFLCSYIYYLKYLKDRKRKYYFFSLLLFLLSLLSKAMAASLPVVLLLTDYFKGYKINTKSLIDKAPYFILALIFGIVAVFAQKTSGATDIAVFPLPQRIIFAGYGFITYLFKLVLPLNLCAYYPYPIKSGSDIPPQYYGYLLLLLGLVAYVFYSLRFSKKIFFAVGFFAATVFLVLQLLPVGGAIMADRYSYIPSIGIFYLAGEGFYWLWSKKNIKTFAFIFLGSAVIFYSVKTNARCGIWKNGMILWTDVINQYQTIPQAYINRGIILATEKKYDEALTDYNKAIQLEPKFSKAYNNRGGLMRTLNKYDDAISDFNKAIELQPDYVKAYNNRGLLMNITKRYDEAIKDYSKAIELKPNFAEAFNNRGVVNRNLNRNEESLSDFNKAIELQPNYYKAYYDRAILMANQNKYDLAINDYNKAIQLQPDYAFAYLKRGNLSMNQKKYDEAINDFNKTINLQPNLAEAYYYRGLSEYYSGKKDNACMDLQEASKLGYQYNDDEYKKICK